MSASPECQLHASSLPIALPCKNHYSAGLKRQGLPVLSILLILQMLWHDYPGRAPQLEQARQVTEAQTVVHASRVRPPSCQPSTVCVHGIDVIHGEQSLHQDLVCCLGLCAHIDGGGWEVGQARVLAIHLDPRLRQAGAHRCKVRRRGEDLCSMKTRAGHGLAGRGWQAAQQSQ